MRVIVSCLLMVCQLLVPASAQQTEITELKASVGEGLRHGLHAKYLRYLAEKLDLSLTIIEMPFARRVKEFREGHLDIFIGVQRVEEKQDEFLYIYPPYETLSYRFYAKPSVAENVDVIDDLAGLRIGINKHARYYSEFDQLESLQKVHVSKLHDKINLLQNDRLDVFIRYQESTDHYLTQQGLDSQIVKTSYQPENVNYYYVAVSSHSPLKHRLQEITNIVSQGVANGDFADIRKQHYIEKAKRQPKAIHYE